MLSFFCLYCLLFFSSFSIFLSLSFPIFSCILICFLFFLFAFFISFRNGIFFVLFDSFLLSVLILLPFHFYPFLFLFFLFLFLYFPSSTSSFSKIFFLAFFVLLLTFSRRQTSCWVLKASTYVRNILFVTKREKKRK